MREVAERFSLLNFDSFLNFYRVTYGDGIGVVAQQLYTVLTRLQMGLTEDEMNWTVELR